MDTLVSVLLMTLAALVTVPVLIFFLEVVAAIALPQRDRSVGVLPVVRPRVAVLVPAHNESAGLVPTLEDIKEQLRKGDRLIVVADNCTDDTAAVAAASNAEVVERHDSTKIGKGYALAFGLQHLSKDPPDIVVMVDADCRLAKPAIERLANACASTHRPIQALYLMTAPRELHLKYEVAEFAWRVKNWVRPLGLRALNLPCQLMGSGMAFPWAAIRSVDLAGGWIVEDLKLGLDLAIAGHSPIFCPSAQTTSTFASSAKGAEIQRKRWEQGHVGMILTMVPHLIWTGVSRANLGLLALALDLAVPPLSLLGLLVAAAFTVSALAALLNISYAPFVVSAATLIGFAVPVFLAWLKYGRGVLPLRAILSIPVYILSKLPMYRHILSRRPAAQWTRTDRTKT